MKYKFKLFLIFFNIVLLSFFNCTRMPDKNVQRKPVTSFSLSDVTLLDGPFKHARKLNIESLLKHEPDRFISKFRTEAGLKPKAEHYGGWESESIAGHSLGHYLSACALMYQSTRDKRFLDRVTYIVDELDTCQKADGEGYIGAIPNAKKIFTEEIAQGNIRSRQSKSP